MSCLREVQTISKSPHILPMPSLTRLTTGGVLNPLKNTTNTSHNELLHQDPLQPPLEPRPKADLNTERTSKRGLPGKPGEASPMMNANATYERKPASLFNGCRLSSPFHHGIQAR